MNKWVIVMIALVACVSAVPASAEDVTSNAATVTVESAVTTAIKAGDGGDLPNTILVDETFTVLITEDGSPVGAGTNVMFTLPYGTGSPTLDPTDADGKATYKPLITGTLGIRVLDGTVTVAEATVNVVTTSGEIPALSSITISPTSCTPDIGDSQTFTAVCKDTDGSVMPCPTLTWTSTDETVGTITSAGVFTALAAGTTTVTASAEGVTSNAAIVAVNAESSGGGGRGGTYPPGWGCTINDTDGDGVPDVWDLDNSTPSGYWVNPQGIGRKWGDMNGDGKLTSVDALMILQAAAGKIGL